MDRMIFVNLPVRDVDVARSFYTGLGFGLNAQFSDDKTACIVVSDTILIMLLVEERFREFITDEVTDTRHGTEVLNALSCESRAEVDDLVARAVAHGGTARTPQDDGAMYGHSFADPDGHVWELIHMDMADHSHQN